MSYSYRVCTESKVLKQDFNFNPCMSEAQKGYEIFMVGSWGNVLFITLAPLALAWLFAYLALWVARWILRGRQILN